MKCKGLSRISFLLLDPISMEAVHFTFPASWKEFDKLFSKLFTSATLTVVGVYF